VASVVAVLIDEWSSVERLAEVSQHGRRFSDLAENAHARFVAGFALRRDNRRRSVISWLLAARKKDVRDVAVMFPHSIVVAVLSDHFVWITISVRTRRPVERNERIPGIDIEVALNG